MKAGCVLCLGLWLGVIVWLPGEARCGEKLERTTQRGPVTARVRLEPSEPVIGDTLLFTIEVTAEPGVEVLMPAFGEALERYAILEFVPREEIDDQGLTRSTQLYRLQPVRSGPQSIPPVLVEFVDRRSGHSAAPEGEDAYELLTERLDFELASVIPRGALPDLRPALGELAALEPVRGPLWPWWAAAGGVLIAGAPFLLRAWLRWRRQARRRSAYEIARGRLDRLLARPSPGSHEEMDGFFVELSGVARHYLEDRFELRSPELTTEEFLEAMAESPDLSAEHQRLLRGLLRRSDLVKFARHLPAEDELRDSVGAAERFLEETRENAPLLEVSAGERPGAFRV